MLTVLTTAWRHNILKLFLDLWQVYLKHLKEISATILPLFNGPHKCIGPNFNSKLFARVALTGITKRISKETKLLCCQNSTFCLDFANLKINRFYGLAPQALRTIRSTVVNLFVPKHSSGLPCRDSELKKGHPDISKQLLVICTVTPLSNFNFSIVQKQWLVCCLSARSSLIPYKCQMSVNFPPLSV